MAESTLETHTPTDGSSNTLSNLKEATEHADREAVLSILNDQKLLTPADIAKYLDIKQQKAEDPVSRFFLISVLDDYLSALYGREQEFSLDQDENDRIAEIAARVATYLETETIATAETQNLENPEIRNLDLYWDNPDFGLEMIEEEVGFMSFSTEFEADVKTIEAYCARLDVRGFEIAIDLIEAKYAGKTAAQAVLRKMVDRQVLIKITKYTKPGSDYDIPYARSLIEKYISDSDRKIVILGKMDVLFAEINDIDPYSKLDGRN